MGAMPAEPIQRPQIPVIRRASSVPAQRSPSGEGKPSCPRGAALPASSFSFHLPRTPSRGSGTPRVEALQSAPPGDRRAAGYVRFTVDGVHEVDITPYSTVYGEHPKGFHFDRSGEKVPSRDLGRRRLAQQAAGLYLLQDARPELEESGTVACAERGPPAPVPAAPPPSPRERREPPGEQGSGTVAHIEGACVAGDGRAARRRPGTSAGGALPLLGARLVTFGGVSSLGQHPHGADGRARTQGLHSPLLQPGMVERSPPESPMRRHQEGRRPATTPGVHITFPSAADLRPLSRHDDARLLAKILGSAASVVAQGRAGPLYCRGAGEEPAITAKDILRAALVAAMPGDGDGRRAQARQPRIVAASPASDNVSAMKPAVELPCTVQGDRVEVGHVENVSAEPPWYA